MEALCPEQCTLMMRSLPELQFGGPRANVWEQNGIKLDTKLKVYKSEALPASYTNGTNETWPRGYNVLMLISTETKIYPAHHC